MKIYRPTSVSFKVGSRCFAYVRLLLLPPVFREFPRAADEGLRYASCAPPRRKRVPGKKPRNKKVDPALSPGDSGANVFPFFALTAPSPAPPPPFRRRDCSDPLYRDSWNSAACDTLFKTAVCFKTRFLRSLARVSNFTFLGASFFGSLSFWRIERGEMYVYTRVN